MKILPDSSQYQALSIMQEAVSVLAKWADAKLPDSFSALVKTDAITTAKRLLSWSETAALKPLRLLFDRVKLSDREEKTHYLSANFIGGTNPKIPYPRSQKPDEFEDLKRQIRNTLSLERFNDEDWQNLSLLTLIIEKFGSFLSFGESDVALIDMARTTAAVAAAIANNSNATELSLVAGDLSGIQNFIYTISSDGALKSLRARSFYLELVTEEVVQQLLAELKFPRTNVIYAGGGNLYILAAGTEETKKAVQKVRQLFNKWLLDKFQGKVFLALDCLSFPIEHIATAKFAEYWSDVTAKNLAGQKSRKFAEQITNFIATRDSYEPCRVCHRDDEENLKPLNPDEPDSVLACGTCRRMFRLGGQLLRVEAIVRSPRENIPGAEEKLEFKQQNQTIYYHLFKRRDDLEKNQDSETLFIVNNWMVDNYRNSNTVPLLLGNYAQESEKEPGCIMRAEEMAEKAKGIARVGYLRMDVDRLGQIFARGLGGNQTLLLPRIAGLSRQISYFFKVYLNSLAEARKTNIANNIKQLMPQDEHKNLLFIYAGGDDLFVSGAWNEIVEFAFDVYQCFRAYTGNNPDITLSGGISIDDVKFPLYRAAKSAKNAEVSAKGNGKDSLGLFGKPFKWSEWLGAENINVSKIEVLDVETKAYLGNEIHLDLFGIFPIVKKIQEQQIEIKYARSFVRNLLDTAQLQDRMIKEIEDKHKQQQYENQLKDIRYYLYLPKIAYTLARLPASILNNSKFTPVRKSLLSQYNALYFRAIATWIELLNRL